MGQQEEPDRVWRGRKVIQLSTTIESTMSSMSSTSSTVSIEALPERWKARVKESIFGSREDRSRDDAQSLNLSVVMELITGSGGTMRGRTRWLMNLSLSGEDSTK